MSRLTLVERDGIQYELHKTSAEKTSPNYPKRLDDAEVPVSDNLEDYIEWIENSTIKCATEAQLCKAIRKSVAIDMQAGIRRADNPKSGKMPNEFVVENSAIVYAQNPTKYDNDGVLNHKLLLAVVKALWESR